MTARGAGRGDRAAGLRTCTRCRHRCLRMRGRRAARTRKHAPEHGVGRRVRERGAREHATCADGRARAAAVHGLGRSGVALQYRQSDPRIAVGVRVRARAHTRPMAKNRQALHAPATAARLATHALRTREGALLLRPTQLVVWMRAGGRAKARRTQAAGRWLLGGGGAVYEITNGAGDLGDLMQDWCD